MDKRDIVLAGMYPSRQKFYSPVQIQKLFFLLDENIPELIDGPQFTFQPYNYGPFDHVVYRVLEELEFDGLVEIMSSNSRGMYRLTNEGHNEAEKIFEALDPKAQRYIDKVSDFVLSLSFSSLVSAIYKAYPEMRRNSVFQD